MGQGVAVVSLHQMDNLVKDSVRWVDAYTPLNRVVPIHVVSCQDGSQGVPPPPQCLGVNSDECHRTSRKASKN